MSKSSKTVFALVGLAVVAACAPRQEPVVYDPVPPIIYDDQPRGKYGVK